MQGYLAKNVMRMRHEESPQFSKFYVFVSNAKNEKARLPQKRK